MCGQVLLFRILAKVLIQRLCKIKIVVREADPLDTQH